jgi:predicted PurR-regulated permease PerM
MGHLLDGSPRSVARATLLVLGVGLLFAIGWAFFDVLIAISFAVLIGTGLYPLVDRLERCGVGRHAAACVVYASLAAVAAALLVLALPVLSERVQSFVTRLPAAHDAIRERLTLSQSLLLRRMGGQLPAQVVSPLPSLGIGPQGAIGMTGSAARALAAAMAVLLASFHFCVHGRHIVARVLVLAPRARRRQVRDFTVLLEQRLGAYLRAQGVICVSVGVLIFTAYSLIGLEDALVLALLAGTLEVLPCFGPVLSAVPALLIALATSPSKALLVLGIVAAVNLFENLFLVPRVMSRAVGVPPAFGLLAIATLGALLGVGGALLAIPTVVMLQLAYHHFVLEVAA